MNALQRGLLQENRLVLFRMRVTGCAFRCDYDPPMSALLAADLFGKDSPLVIRHQPHLVVQSMNPVPRIASKAEVTATMYVA
jgi:hypothetical protein